MENREHRGRHGPELDPARVIAAAMRSRVDHAALPQIGIPKAVKKAEEERIPTTYEDTSLERKEERKRETAVAVAKEAGVNRGSVERMDRLDKERPDLADKVARGEMKPTQAMREMKKDEVVKKTCITSDCADRPEPVGLADAEIGKPDPHFLSQARGAAVSAPVTGTGAGYGYWLRACNRKSLAISIRLRVLRVKVLEISSYYVGNSLSYVSPPVTPVTGRQKPRFDVPPCFITFGPSQPSWRRQSATRLRWKFDCRSW